MTADVDILCLHIWMHNILGVPVKPLLDKGVFLIVQIPAVLNKP